MSVRGAAFLGIGAMVGAGIFALLGEAGAVAGAAVWLSFLLAGFVAVLQGYSFAKLGARYPSAGGLLERGAVVICAGGGGIPTTSGPGRLTGVEAVIDKDFASELLAENVAADLFLMATDVDGVYLDWGTPQQRRLGQVTPEELAGHDFAAGSMGPKVEAAARFAANTGRRAAIGSLADIGGIVAGTAGTSVVAQKAPADVRPGSLTSR